ncbi:MAG: hypothetical protein LRY27_03420 [Chitinophagales bacterium]|nr:hypothetical protein [Chitinophagales bacterium]
MNEFVAKLEKISNLSAADAKSQLVETLKKEAETDALSHIKEIMDESQSQGKQRS